MTQQGFEDYIYSAYNHKSGAAKSYITAIHIIDEMFSYDDVFALKGKSITCVDDTALLYRIAEFIQDQLDLYRKGEDSIFRNINKKQTSYPAKGFCLAAIKQLLNYSDHEHEIVADSMIVGLRKSKTISEKLTTYFDLNKEGSYVEVASRARVGQSYFRKMVLANYENACCVTGLNVPQTLRASHIVAWAEDKKHRMDPENGLCLSATYDAAFDKHLISFDDDYRMIVSKEIKEYYTNEIAQEYFGKYEGKQINLPKLFLPSRKLLEKHRELLIS